MPIEEKVSLMLHVKVIHLSEKCRFTGFLQKGRMESGGDLVQKESCDPPRVFFSLGPLTEKWFPGHHLIEPEEKWKSYDLYLQSFS